MSARRQNARCGATPDERGGSTEAKGRRVRLFVTAIVAAALLAACESTPIDQTGAPPAAAEAAAAPEQAPADNVNAVKKPAARAQKKDTTAQREPSQQPDAPEAAAASAPQDTSGAPSIRFKDSERDSVSEDDEVDEPRKEVDRGTASWYGLQFHGRQTANGERFNMYALTAAHKTLPFGTIVRVRSLQSGRSVDVRINDRGPYVQGRVIDLSKAAAEELGVVEQGLKLVSLTVTEWPDDAKRADPKPDDKPAYQRKKAHGKKSAATRGKR